MNHSRLWKFCKKRAQHKSLPILGLSCFFNLVVHQPLCEGLAGPSPEGSFPPSVSTWCSPSLAQEAMEQVKERLQWRERTGIGRTVITQRPGEVTGGFRGLKPEAMMREPANRTSGSWSRACPGCRAMTRWHCSPSPKLLPGSTG